MAKDKLPWFPLWVNDWLSSTTITLMTPAQEGAYIRLLCHQWASSDCSLPNDDRALAALGRLDPTSSNCLVLLRRLFTECADDCKKIRNERLYSVWLKQREISDKRADAGQKGGLANGLDGPKQLLSKRPSKTKAKPKHSESESDPEFRKKNQSSDSASESDSTGAAHPVSRDAGASLVAVAADQRFVAFWTEYPTRNGKKLGKQTAKRLFLRLSPEDQDEAIEAAKNYCRSERVLNGFSRDAERFLKADFWRDFVTPEAGQPLLDERTRRAASSIDQATQILMGASRDGE